MAKSDKLYKDSPSVERDKESGEVGVKKPSEADGENMQVDGVKSDGEKGGMPVNVHQASERREVKHKHVGEHLAMHHRHEMEHESMPAEGGDKKTLTKKHDTELSAMHDRHAQEMLELHKRQNKE